LSLVGGPPIEKGMQFAMLFVSLIREVVLFSVKGAFGTEKKNLSFKGWSHV
jgi:hypothetical protein